MRTRWILIVLLVAIGLPTGVLTVAYGGFLRTIVLGRVSDLVLDPPSERDEFFNLVAVDFERPDLCNRIGWRADASTGGGWGAPFRIRTLRSACRSNLNLPPNVIHSEVPLSMPVFAAQLRALGYTDADVLQAAHAENYTATPIYSVYESLLADKEFRSRLRAAPGYDEPRDRARLRPARPLEFMYQMVAIDAPEAALCSRISPNATFDHAGATMLLQSWCYLHIAFNTRDLRLCEPLPAARSFPHINENYDSRERCRETVAIYSRPDFKGGGTYGSVPLPRAADFQPILREIGYQADTLPHVPEPTADDYWEFVSRLIHRGPAKDRAEFLRRVEAIE